MGRAVDHLRAAGHPAPDHLLAYVAPPGWSHTSLTGDYVWQETTPRAALIARGAGAVSSHSADTSETRDVHLVRLPSEDVHFVSRDI